LVGPEQMPRSSSREPGRGQEPSRDVLIERIVGGEDGGGQRHRHVQEDDDQANDSRALAHERGNEATAAGSRKRAGGIGKRVRHG